MDLINQPTYFLWFWRVCHPWHKTWWHHWSRILLFIILVYKITKQCSRNNVENLRLNSMLSHRLSRIRNVFETYRNCSVNILSFGYSRTTWTLHVKEIRNNRITHAGHISSLLFWPWCTLRFISLVFLLSLNWVQHKGRLQEHWYWCHVFFCEWLTQLGLATTAFWAVYSHIISIKMI